jgi:restriction system protein
MKTKSQSEFVRWMGPVLDGLRALGDTGTPYEVSDWIATHCNVTDEKREELLTSGVSRFHNQVCWARQYLVWEGLLGSAKRGLWSLTETGKSTHLSLDQSSEIVRKWVAIHAQRRKDRESDNKEIEVNLPVEDDEETTEMAEHTQLLSLLQTMTPHGFENFCKYLLRVYGFEKVEVTPVGKDGGIDGYGVLQLNPFVSFKVIFQCKRYLGTVSRAQVGDLRNAMIGRADKGIMITTGIFSEDAKREASREGAPPIELIDGQQLISMLEKEEIGVKPRTVYDIDYAFFKPYLN